MSFINIMDIVYPVGSLYFSSSNISPANLFGGTWTCVQKDFVPETLVSSNAKKREEINSSNGSSILYNTDIQNGSFLLSVIFSGQNRVFGGSNTYQNIVWKSFYPSSFTRVPWDIGIKTVPAVHAMGGEFPQNYSGYLNDSTSYNSKTDPVLMTLYNKSREITYGGASAVSFLEIPSRTQCYIWMRTA